ncbi:hypothetical protein K7472_05590 [Streptomyces sp. PTM05]|uniref:Uncharacterized protein n=1 Tax=Streptantibioticus parmotrematis TaxID=2873249 RepID=A0ABS7QMA0_9ACTN|nr:hypothetical protein [Streptantibioticus parmotrematis]MBY8884321.1 hypothetical protein [Streptantibioticus parmotrematis]
MGTEVADVSSRIVAKLFFGGSYERSTPINRARQPRGVPDATRGAAAGVFAGLEQIVLDTYDRVMGLDLADITVDGQITEAPCGGEAAGNSGIDRENPGSSGRG